MVIFNKEKKSPVDLVSRGFRCHGMMCWRNKVSQSPLRYRRRPNSADFYFHRDLVPQYLIPLRIRSLGVGFIIFCICSRFLNFYARKVLSGSCQVPARAIPFINISIHRGNMFTCSTAIWTLRELRVSSGGMNSGKIKSCRTKYNISLQYSIK